MTPESMCPSVRRRVLAVVAELLLVVVLTCIIPASAWPSPGAYRAPLAPKATVVRGFDPPAHRWESGHRGVDLAARTGEPVMAAGSGTVRFTGTVADKPVVSIAHAGGLITTYEPVRASVRVGESVRRGETIGTLDPGHPGCSVSTCLHWGARRGAGRDAEYFDPLALLGAVRVRLKPVGDGPAGVVTPADAPDDAPPATVPR